MQARIVVIDVTPSIVALICDVLNDAGLQTMVCRHRRETVCSIERLDPNLVVLDVQMHEMDGIAIVGALQANV